MTKVAKALALTVCATIVVATVPVTAATPPGATLSKKMKSVSWTGSFLLSEPTPVSGCAGEDADPICDRFMLKVDLGEGAKLKVVIPGQLGDLDLAVYAPGRVLVGSSGNPPGAGESVEFTHRARYRNRPYTVEVKPFAVLPTTSYKGTATVLKLGAK